MNNKLDEASSRRWVIWASLYAGLVLALAGFLNYIEPYSPDPVITPSPSNLIIWASLYLPIIVLPIVAGLKVTDFGFTLNPLLALAAVLIVMMCSFSGSTATATWRSALVEAFARTGEEIFFRGFLFVLFCELFRNKRRPWLWAAIASSLLFALVHTQMLQPGYLAQYGSLSMPGGYQIMMRLLNLFSIAFVFALLRAWTHSILPGAISHSLSQAGITTLPFVLIIYGAATLWAYRRAEPVILQVNSSGRLA